MLTVLLYSQLPRDDSRANHTGSLRGSTRISEVVKKAGELLTSTFVVVSLGRNGCRKQV